jgi:hypothetical protein
VSGHLAEKILARGEFCGMLPFCSAARRKSQKDVPVFPVGQVLLPAARAGTLNTSKIVRIAIIAKKRFIV